MLDYIVERAWGQFSARDPSLFRRKNKSVNEKPSSNRDFEDTILKMAEIKKLTSKYFPPEEVKEILMTAACKIRGNNPPLDQALEEFRKKARVREATDYLKS